MTRGNTQNVRINMLLKYKSNQHSIFNEWHAAQTSKKIHEVWKVKANEGKRIASSIPYGYMRAPDEKNKWIVDEKAAEVVKRIFDLCLQGVGIGKIASTLEKENVLNPTAHFIEQGINTRNPLRAPLKI